MEVPLCLSGIAWRHRLVPRSRPLATVHIRHGSQGSATKALIRARRSKIDWPIPSRLDEMASRLGLSGTQLGLFSFWKIPHLAGGKCGLSFALRSSAVLIHSKYREVISHHIGRRHVDNLQAWREAPRSGQHEMTGPRDGAAGIEWTVTKGEPAQHGGKKGK